MPIIFIEFAGLIGLLLDFFRFATAFSLEKTQNTNTCSPALIPQQSGTILDCVPCRDDIVYEQYIETTQAAVPTIREDVSRRDSTLLRGHRATAFAGVFLK
jgi:hypothetical protein